MHEERAVTGSIFAAKHAHSKIVDVAGRSLADPTLYVLVPLVPSIDDGVDGFYEMGESSDGLINRGASLDEGNNSTDTMDGEDEVPKRMVAEEGEAALGVNSVDGLIDLGDCSVVDLD